MKNYEDIMRMIAEEDVEFIRLQFTDIFGSLKNIAVTPSQMEQAFNGEYSFEGKTIFGELDVTEDDLYLKPDPDTFVILPWRPQQGKVGKLICDVVCEDGSPFQISPREILKKVMGKYEALGLKPVINTECEFFLFHTDENGQPTTVTHESAGYMDVGPLDLGENVRRDIVLTLSDMGFEIESSHHEKASGQHEIDFKGTEPLLMADSLMTLKFAVRSIARRFGMCATFMPKPVANTNGSGMHFNVVLYKDGKNVFMPDENRRASDLSMKFIDGVLEHATAICAVTNPTVNSYKRLGSGFDAPDKIDWSLKGEASFVKLHKRGEKSKIELRFPDPSANPYLALAVCLEAGLWGIMNGKIPEGNIMDKRLPDNLLTAVSEFEKDKLFLDLFGDKLVSVYSDAKKQEWSEYMQQVTRWEIDRYLMKM